MTIEQFKALSHPEKLKEIRYNGNLLGPYERPSEDGGRKTQGDIYQVHEFWVFLSEDEEMVIPTRKNPVPAEEEEEE
jgi:hypothetical protein